MGYCISKYSYNEQKYDNSDMKYYEGSFLNDKKSGIGIEFSLSGKKIYE